MNIRKPIRAIQGEPAVDGAGVHLIRVLGHDTARMYDPFLMLDSFDATDSELYIKGFPMHPHRGIETITYLIEGEMEHRDSLGNEGLIRPGGSQWMTAGSGILHEEMPHASPRMLGVQIWLNLPRELKMTAPAYFDITKDMIPIKETDNGTVRVIAGKFEDVSGVTPPHLPVTLLDVSLELGQSIEIQTDPDQNVFAFSILGTMTSDGELFAEKTAVLFDEGDTVKITAAEEPCRFLFFSGPYVEEPIAWGGPVVMNTQEELREAFKELREGTFIREDAK